MSLRRLCRRPPSSRVVHPFTHQSYHTCPTSLQVRPLTKFCSLLLSSKETMVQKRGRQNCPYEFCGELRTSDKSPYKTFLEMKVTIRLPFRPKKAHKNRAKKVSDLACLPTAAPFPYHDPSPTRTGVAASDLTMQSIRQSYLQGELGGAAFTRSIY